MSAAIDLAVSTPTKLSEMCLGLCLGSGQVGIAVASSEDLLRDCVLSIRKIPSPDGRLRRFQQVIARLLASYPITRMAAVIAQEPTVHGLCAAQLVWLEGLCHDRALPLGRLSASQVRCGVVRQGLRATNRQLANELSGRFEQLLPKAPCSEMTPGADRVPELALRPRAMASPRERYWRPMFLALGGACLNLEEHLSASLGPKHL